MPTRLYLLPALLLGVSALHAERVIGPDVGPGRYKHPASITQLDNGDLYLAFYGGDGEYAPGTGVFGMRRAAVGGQWSKPELLARDPMYSVGNPVVWQAPDGLVWLFYVVRPGATWSTSRIAAKISKDGGSTWSDSTIVSWEEGTMVRSRPIVLRDGAYILPIYHETGYDTEKIGADTTALFLRLDAGATAWTESNRVTARLGVLQPAVVELDDGTLIAYCRRGGDYDPGDDGTIVRTESRDGGRTWTEGVETEFPNPNAAVDLLRLQDGRLLLVYNHSMDDRTPLAAAISNDQGQSFERLPDIATGDNSFAYPYALQTSDGQVYAVYSSNGRTTLYLDKLEIPPLQR